MRTSIDLLGWIRDELAEIRALGRERMPVHIASAPGPEVDLDGARLAHLCSNNYLGLAADPRVIEAAVDATRTFGTGSGGSRLVSGGSAPHRELEQRLAAWKGTEDAILFSSGYLANVGTITALAHSGDRILSDALNHASVVDGCRLSGARIEVYAHGDASDLATKLRAPHDGRTLVVTDSVFSMDGDVAPLTDIAEACERAGAMLMVDEAHAAGILGADGAGAVSALDLGARAPIVLGTLSKALGSAGGYVCGPFELVSLLRNRARTFIFDTALPPGPIAAATRALEIAIAEPERRARALTLARRLASGARALGADVAEPAACIVPIAAGDERAALALSARLKEAGIFAPAIRPPSVAPGSCRIRMTTMSTHTDGHIDRTIAALAGAL